MSTPPANLRGWGQGWPVDRSDDMEWVESARSGTRFQVHREIAPIIKHCIDEVERRGYLLHRPGQVRDDWSYVNRAIRGRNVASNHSWGLAIDIDATQFPLGSTKRLPQWIVDVFRDHGFDYGGDWKRRPDPMHFEFNGWPSDARRIVARIKRTPPTVVAASPPPYKPPPPAAPTVRRKPVYLLKARDADAIWITDGIQKTRVPHPDFVTVHQRQLKALGLPTTIRTESAAFVNSIPTRA